VPISPSVHPSRVGGRLLVGAVLVLLAACGRTSTPAPEGLDARTTPLLPEDRLELPAFDFEAFQALLLELRGTPVVVNIWGSWCPPCQVEAPDLARVSSEFEGRVQFVGVDILDSRASARDFILAFDWAYPSVFDPEGEIRDRLGYIGQPITVVYDRRGAVSFEWTGVVTADLLRAEIRKALGA
jgi:thiol-disulfide isomerase/thioredoxin